MTVIIVYLVAMGNEITTAVRETWIDATRPASPINHKHDDDVTARDEDDDVTAGFKDAAGRMGRRDVRGFRHDDVTKIDRRADIRGDIRGDIRDNGDARQQNAAPQPMMMSMDASPITTGILDPAFKSKFNIYFFILSG